MSNQVSTLDRAAINRANAKKSTGPRTPAGKQRASLNALRHGLTGQTVVLPAEDLVAYQTFTKSFLDQFQPKTVLETQLVHRLADTGWRLNRVSAMENNMLTLGFTEQSGTVNTDHPEAHAALVIAKVARDQSQTLCNFSIYEQRLTRQFDKTLKQVQELQSWRQQQEWLALREAAQLLQMHQDKKQPYHPAEDGFVFSNTEIEAHIRREQRRLAASEANHAREASA